MKQKRLENICRGLLAYVEKGYEIDEDQGLRLIEGLAPYDGSEEGMPEAYMKLLDEIGARWQYRDMEQMTVEEVLVFGSIWGCLQMAEARRRYIRNDILEKRQWPVLVNRYTDKEWLLKIVHSQPGVRHKDLAEKGKKSPSQMTQLLGGIVRDGLITYNTAGREKFYFLSETGERLYQELKAKKKAEKVRRISPKTLCMENDGDEINEIINLVFAAEMNLRFFEYYLNSQKDQQKSWPQLSYSNDSVETGEGIRKWMESKGLSKKKSIAL